MTLYEITGQFVELFDMFDMIDDLDPEQQDEAREAWYDTLQSIESDFEDKADNVAVYIKTLASLAREIKFEEEQLRKRRQSTERKIDSLKRYLFDSMRAIGRTKIETPQNCISIRRNAPSVKIENEDGLIRWAQAHNDDLLKYAPPEIRKNDVKKLLKDGEEVPFCHLEQSESLVIK